MCRVHSVHSVHNVHGVQRVEERAQPRTQLGLVGRAAELGQRALERRAFVRRHHPVGRAVLFPEAVHLDERRVVEAREQLRVVDEALQADRAAMANGMDSSITTRRASAWSAAR